MRSVRAVVIPSALLALCSLAGTAFAEPSAAERALVQRVQAQEQSSIALLEQIVNVNSGTMNFAGVRKVADMLRPRFEALGFKVRWEDGAAFGRAGHLIAEHPGPGRHVLLIGHLDTVFEPNHPFQRFERVDAQTVKGPGTSDMKGGLIVALAALTALKETKALDRMHITMVMMGDEEDAGQPITAARAALVAAAKAADVAIGLENGADDPKTALTARRGYTGWRIDVKARSAHSSQIFTDDVGAGAIYELARILHTFYDELHGEELLTFNPGLIAGSTQLNFDQEKLHAETFGKDNIVAPVAVATGDLRTISSEQLERTKERMRKIVAASPHDERGAATRDADLGDHHVHGQRPTDAADGRQQEASGDVRRGQPRPRVRRRDCSRSTSGGRGGHLLRRRLRGNGDRRRGPARPRQPYAGRDGGPAHVPDSVAAPGRAAAASREALTFRP